MADDAMESESFGAITKLTPDGRRAIIRSGNNTAYVFDFIDGNWVETMRLTASDPDVVGIAHSIDITDDGSTVLLGAPNAKVNGVFWYGAAALFDLEAPLGDLNCDGVISTVDLLILFSNWGDCFYWDPEDGCLLLGGCLGDLNLDCTVDTSDLLILLSNWG